MCVSVCVYIYMHQKYQRVSFKGEKIIVSNFLSLVMRENIQPWNAPQMLLYKEVIFR